MNVSAKSFVFMFFAFLTLPILAKEIPVTKNIINSQADAVIVGEVKKISSLTSKLSIEVLVVEKFFDRRNTIAGIVILNLHQQGISADLKVGEKYVFVTSVCENGAHVLLGRNFAANVKNGYADTLGWYGFDKRTKLTTLRSELGESKEKDPLLTNEICKILFDCRQERESKNMEIP